MIPHYVQVILPSGNRAVYEVQPQHATKAEWARMYGKQVAHSSMDHWYRPGGWEEFDPGTQVMLAATPLIE